MVFTSQKPLFHLGKFPIGATELIILLQIIGMLAVVFTQGRILPYVDFSAKELLSGNIWRVITYPFFNHVGLFFFIGLYFFYQFGRIVETQLGRSTFLYTCGGIVLCIPMVYCLYFLMGGNPTTYYGSQILSLGVFCCFCVMYPNLPTMLLQIPIKWLGLFLLSIALLGAIQSGAFDQLIAILLSVSFALIVVQSRGLAIVKLFPNAWIQPSSQKKTKRPQIVKKTKKSPPVSKLKPKPRVKSETKVDAILDKISEKGLHSLTDKERAILQNSRNKR